MFFIFTVDKPNMPRTVRIFSLYVQGIEKCKINLQT